MVGRINLAIPLILVKLNRRKANDTLLVISERRATRERRREREKEFRSLGFTKKKQKVFKEGITVRVWETDLISHLFC